MRLAADQATHHRKAERDIIFSYSLEVGDKVFLQKPFKKGAEGVSRRLQSRYHTQISEVSKIPPPVTNIFCDPAIKCANLDFEHHVSASRLVPHDLQQLEESVHQSRPLRLRLHNNDDGTSDVTITYQSATGAVRLAFADGAERVVNLENEVC